MAATAAAAGAAETAAIVAMTGTKLIGVRDPLGVRPLVLGKVAVVLPRILRYLLGLPNILVLNSMSRL